MQFHNDLPRYPCDMCEYVPKNLRLHKESKHKGIRHPCGMCENTATTHSPLKKHKDSQQGGIRYPMLGKVKK